MEIFNVFDVCVIGFCTFCVGMLVGLIINSKHIKNLKEEVYAGDESYMSLLDKYIELSSSHRNLMLANAKTKLAKRGPGRPKGSTNKTKKDGRSTTRNNKSKSSK